MAALVLHISADESRFVMMSTAGCGGNLGPTISSKVGVFGVITPRIGSEEAQGKSFDGLNSVTNSPLKETVIDGYATQ